MVWFRTTGLPATRPSVVCIPCGDHRVIWASPFTRGLATTTGRIEFVILRTGRSPPVALHLPSRGRSYPRLQSTDLTMTGTFTPLIQRAYRRTSAAIHRRFSAGDRACLRLLPRSVSSKAAIDRRTPKSSPFGGKRLLRTRYSCYIAPVAELRAGHTIESTSLQTLPNRIARRCAAG
jgi:hypothetical protein